MPWPTALVKKTTELGRLATPEDFTPRQRAIIHAALAECIRLVETSLAHHGHVDHDTDEALVGNLGELQDNYVAFSVALGVGTPRIV